MNYNTKWTGLFFVSMLVISCSTKQSHNSQKTDPEELFNWHYERPDLVEEFEKIIQKEHRFSEHWPLKNEHQ